MMKKARHVAVIMDGNGRWAKARGCDRLYGHAQGVEALRDVVRAATASEVEYLTVYAFSSENWGRPKEEVDGLMELLASTIVAEAAPLAQNGVRLCFIGDLSALSSDLRSSIDQACTMNIAQLRLTLVIALNYGSRADIVAAANRLLSSGVERITEENISENLSTASLPAVDLLVRTSGEQRLSNFLLWELSYSEIYFTPVLWPDFRGDEFLAALEWFGGRERRFGKL